MLRFDSNIPTVLFIGGSLGAKFINETVVDALPKLVEKCQIIHQTGKNNFPVVRDTAKLVLKDVPEMNRYRIFDYLDNEYLRMAAGAADLIVSRAGSSLFEIAAWGKPSILIPITESANGHQRRNAHIYEKTGACVVIEENNLSPNLLISEIGRLLNDVELREKMAESARNFSRPDAAEKIARAIVNIALSHEIS
jgi:UDP-N-acetylglucosamine--N-acetylmuramyl-(pentapeptide) pyrophosphoryl-undecaprenol N-acetylglucosamine transferase